jgi:NADP-reducing hydrogenase subunit HndC
MNISELKKLNRIIDDWKHDPDYAIEMLQDIQRKFGSLNEDILRYLADEIKVPLGQIYHIVTFYKSFTLKTDQKDESETKTPVDDIKILTGFESVVLRNAGRVDPKKIRTYTKYGGYKSLKRAIREMSQGDLLKEVRESGLKGRGGGALVADKWGKCIIACRKLECDPCIICNAFDYSRDARSNSALLEMDPHSVIEGMTIAAYTVDAVEGFIFVCNEYEKALESITKAIEQARKNKFLGEKILDSDFDFDIKIRRGSEAYIAGLSDSVIASMSGRAPEPGVSNIPIIENGYRGLPTLMNNAETFANVPIIIEKGGAWFSRIGNRSNGINTTGTKIMSLTGDVSEKGLVEVPVGTPLSEIINVAGGGTASGNKFKAVQVGGASGCFLPAELGNQHLDNNNVSQPGTFFGSGQIHVLSDQQNVIEATRDSVAFLAKESCGKCTPCREGLQVIKGLLDKIIDGDGTMQDIESIKSIVKTISVASLCEYGKQAVFPVTSSLKYFMSEYESCVK